jgi:hypothetical protein
MDSILGYLCYLLFNLEAGKSARKLCIFITANGHE